MDIFLLLDAPGDHLLELDSTIFELQDTSSVEIEFDFGQCQSFTNFFS